jgi:hypothetical protein
MLWKILNSIFLLGFTCDYINEYREKKRQKAEAERQKQEERKQRRHSVGSNNVIKQPTSRPKAPKRCMSEAAIPNLETLRASAPPSREGTPQHESPRKVAVSPRTRRISEKSDFTEDKPPLSDIDRYSMCSNRIV